MRVGKEIIEHIKVAEYLRHKKIPFYHFANEGKRGYQNASLLRKMGFRAGVSDLFMPRHNLQYSGLWIELKTITGVVSPSQKEFLETMIEEGYAGCVAYGADEAISIIDQFYEIDCEL